MNEFPALKEQIRQASEITEIVGSYGIALHQNGRTLIGLCPFHTDRTPSFTIYPSTQSWYCFSCRIGGDVFDFVERKERLSFRDAFQHLARRAGIVLSSWSQDDEQAYVQERQRQEELTQEALRYHEQLTPEARRYLTQERGFADELIDTWKIGYASTGYFAGCITFPNWLHGRVVDIQGRSFPTNPAMKYKNHPGPVQHLFNEAALCETTVFIAEGIPDCLTLLQAGYAACGIYGTGGFKPEWVERFRSEARVYIVMDGDAPGRHAAVEIAKHIGSHTRIVNLPDGVDVNELFLTQSKAAFEDRVHQAQDVMAYQLSLISADTPHAELADALRPMLRQIAFQSPPQAEAYLDQIKERFGLHREEVIAYRKLVGQLRKQAEETAEADDASAVETYTALFDGLVDLVEDEGQVAFLVKDSEGLCVRKSVEREGVPLRPPPKEQIPWLLPRASEVLQYYQEDTDARLYDDLVSYHRSVSELPNEEWLDIQAAWDLHTYVHDRPEVQHSPMLWFYAVPERGKTRTGKGHIYVAYRGIHVESLRDAYLVRVAKCFQATVFFDVMDIWRKAEQESSQDVLLLRYEKGATVPRVLYPDRGPFRDTVYFPVFGATLIGTNVPVNQILETRCLMATMPSSTRAFETPVTPETSLPLKERLMAFRARHMATTLPELNKPVKGRLGDITKPLVQIIRLVRPEREEALRQMILSLEQGRKQEKADTIEGQLILVIRNLADQVSDGKLSVQQIADAINTNRPEKSKLSNRSIGWKLRALGFQKTTTSAGNAAIYWDDQKLEKVMVEHGLVGTPEIPETQNVNETIRLVQEVFPGTEPTNEQP